jgi:hypothetical protein
MRPIRPARGNGTDLDHGRSPEVTTTGDAPMLIRSGPMLCRLCLWTDEQWEALPAAERPASHTHAPGLGWVGAVPILCLN